MMIHFNSMVDFRKLGRNAFISIFVALFATLMVPFFCSCSDNDDDLEELLEKTKGGIEKVQKGVSEEEPKLVRVTYKRDWEWVEPHDNMALFYYAKVHRTRHYSSGESFTDTFMDGGHMAAMGLSAGQWEEPIKWADGEVYLFQNPQERVNVGDSIYILNQTSFIKILQTHRFL